MRLVHEAFIRGLMRQRENHSHKGDYGRGIIIGGKEGMAGSVTLSSKAALRSGIGLNHLFAEESVTQIVNQHSIETITHCIPGFKDEAAVEAVLEEHLARKDALAFGPGLGQGEALVNLLKRVLSTYEGPMVIDGDGLNLVAKNPEVLRHHPQVVLTPHEMEMSRLIGGPLEDVINNRQSVAEEFARAYQVLVVLKGHETIITDGKQTFVNTTGNPGMATAGSGDVLTGIVYAHLAKGYSLQTAALIAVFIHGLSGDLAVKDLGEESLIASDLVDYLPLAFQSLLATKR